MLERCEKWENFECAEIGDPIGEAMDMGECGETADIGDIGAPGVACPTCPGLLVSAPGGRLTPKGETPGWGNCSSFMQPAPILAAARCETIGTRRHT
mmetsp:Transcript_56470/g.123452  ORF Transcript_56470/g.123452 Transcript_56470/m.123452 type:complete len:97 (-) Transcript_56470:100-390(-)